MAIAKLMVVIPISLLVLYLASAPSLCSPDHPPSKYKCVSPSLPCYVANWFRRIKIPGSRQFRVSGGLSRAGWEEKNRADREPDRGQESQGG